MITKFENYNLSNDIEDIFSSLIDEFGCDIKVIHDNFAKEIYNLFGDGSIGIGKLLHNNVIKSEKKYQDIVYVFIFFNHSSRTNKIIRKNTLEVNSPSKEILDFIKNDKRMKNIHGLDVIKTDFFDVSQDQPHMRNIGHNEYTHYFEVIYGRKIK